MGLTWDPYTNEKNSSLKKFKEGPHAGRPVITITGQASHLCLTNSVGEPLSKDGQMPAFVSSTRWSMELWQYPSQITSSLHVECPVTVTHWHFFRYIQTGTIIVLILSTGYSPVVCPARVCCYPANMPIWVPYGLPIWGVQPGSAWVPYGLAHMGMFKNNEAFHFMASYAHICIDFKDQT